MGLLLRKLTRWQIDKGQQQKGRNKMMTNEEIRRYDNIVECGIATAEELNLAFNLTSCGWSETIDKVIYIRTGYTDYNDWITAEDEEEE